MTASRKTVNRMKEAIVNFSGDQKEFDKIWDSFYTQVTIGVISRETWIKFHEECRGWYIEENEHDIYVRDGRRDDAIVWRYNPETEYKA